MYLIYPLFFGFLKFLKIISFCVICQKVRISTQWSIPLDIHARNKRVVREGQGMIAVSISL